MFSVKRLLVFAIIGFLPFCSFGLWAGALMSLKPGDPVPDFHVRTIDGREVTLGSLKGKIVILAFWKRSQDYSERALADLERIYQEYGDRGVTVTAINADKALEPEIRGIGTAQNLTYPMASDPELKVYHRFGVIALPTTLVIDPSGKLAYARSIHTKTFYPEVQGEVRVLTGEITRTQLEAELNPQKIPVDSEARKKANRYLNLGRALLDMGLKDKAREQFEQAAEADPSFVEPHIHLAKLYLEDDELGKGGSELEQALKLGDDSGSKEAKLLKGIAHARQGEDSQAISVLKGVVENNSNPPPEAYYQIGRIYEKQNKTSQALEAYQTALKLMIGQ